ncbi:hypothetical protein ACFXCZ_21905 [Streptomyces sp. NPDC059396]|uniref:hypothetical protein n=1 Tax=Streptomyces sp. NPDC059396 TaxID=3346819 RepID=UPI0036C3EE3E
MTLRRLSLYGRGPGRAVGATVAAATVLGGALSGYAPDTGVRDAGAAADLSVHTDALPERPEARAAEAYPPLDGIRVPADGGLDGLSVAALLSRDPRLPERSRAALRDCPGPRCPVRPPVYEDVTGDGRAELVVAVDEPAARRTFLAVYQAAAGRVRPLLVHPGAPGAGLAVAGGDLLLTVAEDAGPRTVRYRWDGAALTAVGDEISADTALAAAVRTSTPALLRTRTETARTPPCPPSAVPAPTPAPTSARTAPPSRTSCSSRTTR